MEKSQLMTIIIAVVIVIIGAISAVVIYTQKESRINALMSQNTDLSRTMQQKDSVMNDLENTFNEIENNLKFIKEKRQQLSVDQEEGGKDKKQAVIEDINLMNTMLEESSKKIDELERKLKKSGLNLRAFEQRMAALNKNVENQNSEIAELKKIIEQKDSQMADLNSQIEEMNTDMSVQQDSIQSKQRMLEEKTNKLNLGHIAFGTRKELKEKGLLTREGGFLGIGGAKTLEENFDDSYFTDLDIRETTTIPLHSKKAMVISDHPDDSYSLVEEDGQIAYLQINNPGEFWKISKYAVIEVK